MTSPRRAPAKPERRTMTVSLALIESHGNFGNSAALRWLLWLRLMHR